MAKSVNKNIEDIYSLSPLQEGMLFNSLVDEGSSAYIIQLTFQVNIRLEEEIVIKALTLLSQRFPVLRTSFCYRKVETPRQIVLRKRQLELNVFDWSNKDEETFKDDYSNFLKSDIDRKFELQKDPLLRVSIIRESHDKQKLIITMHHIIMDGWCNKKIVNQFFYYYASLVNGTSYADLENEVFHEKNNTYDYKEYIKWIGSQDKKTAMKYWEELLSDYDNNAEILPVMQKHDTEDQMREIYGMISVSSSEKLKQIAENNEITLNTLVETVVGVMLQAYSKSNDVVFGKVVSGRNAPIPGIEDMVGLFINTIPVRVKANNETTIIELLKQQQKQGSESSNYDYLSLADIQNLTIQCSDLIKVIFIFENFNSGLDIPESTGNNDIITTEGGREQTNYALSISSYEENGTIAFKIMFNPQIYSDDEIKLILDRLSNICEEIADNPNIMISDIETVTDSEKELIFDEFNATEKSYPKDKTIVEMFEEQVRKTPDNDAVVFGDAKLSYAELNEKANVLGNKLRGLGVGRDDFVAIIADRSIEMMAGIYGIIKAGGAYVPIDPTYPKDRINFMLEDSKPKAILKYTSESITINNEITVIDLADRAVWEGTAENPKHINKSDDLIYCIYTSGTTGKPKGVMNRNYGLINRILWMNERYPIGSGDTILQKTTYTFDVSVWEIIWWSIVGARVAMLVPGGEKEPDTICDSIERYNVTTMHFVPSMLAMLEEYVQSSVGAANKLRSIRNVFVSGEALKKAHVDSFYKIAEGAGLGMKLANFYGPTEASIDVTYYDCIVEDKINVPIGKPIYNTQIYIVNGKKLCGVGVPGELCIAGDGLARGYLNRPELTEEKFADNMFDEGKMYHSGDLAMWLPDGNIEYLGRIDDQIKIRGQRLELSEIEAKIREITNIRNCTVIAKADSSGEKAIYAYYTSDSELSVSVVRDKLREGLPEYMVPAYMMQIETIPVTKNGKLDRRALPEIEARAIREYVAPRNEAEEKISTIFSEILGVERVGIKDSFFELGGHSLRATRLVNRIEAETGTRIALKDVFSHPTVEQLALLALGEDAKYVSIPKAEVKEYYPMSSAQKRTYLIQQIDPDSKTYNMPQNVKLTGKVRPDVLKAALQEMTARHEILRTQFLMIGSKPVQKIPDYVEADFKYLSSNEPDEKLMTEFLKPFDLASGKPVRVMLVDKGEYHLLMIDMHHIVSDGMSNNIFMKEYMALCNGEQLKPDTRQYKDYSEWMRTRELSGQAEYWKSQFDDEIPVLDMPTDFPRPLEQSYDGDITGTYLDDKLYKKVEKIVHDEGVTDFMFFLAVTMVTLSKYSRQEDIIVGSPISGRTHRDTEKMLGMFVNTLALRGKLDKNKSFSTFLNEIKETCLKAYENQDYPFEELIDRVNVKRDLSRNPVFDVMLSLQNNENLDVKFGEGENERMAVVNHIAKFDLSFDITKYKDKLIIVLEYCTALFKKETAENILKHFTDVVRSVVDDIKKPIKDIKMIGEEEKVLILNKFNSNKNICFENENETVISLFEKQVEKTPDAIAITYGETNITYGMFNFFANVIVNRLYGMNIQPDDLVVIIADRGIEMLCGIFGILKSGGAYVPVNPEDPDDRIKSIIADCQPKAIVKFTENDVHVDYDIPVVDLATMNKWDRVKKENIVCETISNNIAYCIYTSGTSGKAKGVLVEHRNLLSYVEQFIDYYGINSESVILQQAYIGFDTSIEEIYPVLLTGGRLVIVSKEVLLDMEELENVINREQVNIISCSPLLIQEMHFLTSSSVKQIISGGDVLSHSCVEALDLSEKNVYNTYGPTEATVCATYYKLPENEEHSSIPIGKPIANSSVYIINDDQLCGIGVPGEICISGSGVARGYLNRNELTEKKFVHDPFEIGMMYRSGDLGKWLSDGNIEYLGRIDEQIKIRGFRIEIGEIERNITEMKEIESCVVVANEDETNGKALFAYYTSSEIIAPTTIKDRLMSVLPYYMIPERLMQIDRILVTKNGKIDKKALPNIKLSCSAEYIAPETEEEIILAEAFEKVLNIDKVGVNDDFFSLGGDSIKAIRIISIIRDGGLSLTVKDIMTAREIRKIIPLLVKSERVYEQGEVNGIVPKTPIIRMFNGYNYLRPEYFNQSVMIDLPRINGTLIHEALIAVIKHHDILRSVYMNGQLAILPTNESSLVDYYEFDCSQETNQASVIYNKCNEIHSSIDLEHGPLVKAASFDTGNVKKMFICIHHLIVDVVSWRIITEDFNTAISQLSAGHQIELPDKTASFIEWAKALEEYHASSRYYDDIKYWDKMKSCFEGADLNYEITTDEFRGYADVNISFDSTITEQLIKNSGTAYNTNVNDILISSLIEAIHRAGWQDRMVVYLESHGRADMVTHIDVDRTVGWFTSIYPVVVQVYESIEDTIIRTKDVLHSVPNLGIAYGLAYNSDIVMPDGIEFNYLGEFDSSSNNSNEDEVFSSSINIAPENKGPCSVSVNVMIENGVLRICTSYDRTRYTESFMSRLADIYCLTLEEFIDFCSKKHEKILTASDFSDIIDADDFESIIDNI